MHIAKIPGIDVLLARRRLRLTDVSNYLPTTLAALEADAASRNLEFTGPWIFVSHNLPQDAVTYFDFAICRPISTSDINPGKFEVDVLPEFTCATTDYQGPLSGIHTGGYLPLLDGIFTANLVPTGEIREVHHIRGHPDSPTNCVAIQIGVDPNSTIPENENPSRAAFSA